jgi:hypothetical protein
VTDSAGPPSAEPTLDLAEPTPDLAEPESSSPAAEPPAAVDAPTVPIERPPLVESTRRLLGASFDLLGRASDDMRRASFYIGLIVLGTVAPVALAAFAIEVVSIHKTAAEIDELLDAGIDAWPGLLLILLGIGVGVAYFESRIMAATILGGHLVGRPVTVRRAVARSRMVFWYAVIAWLIVFFPVLIAQTTLAAIFARILGEQTDVSLVTSVLV